MIYKLTRKMSKRKSATIFDFFFLFFFFFLRGAKRSKDGDDGEACEWWRNFVEQCISTDNQNLSSMILVFRKVHICPGH